MMDDICRFFDSGLRPPLRKTGETDPSQVQDDSDAKSTLEYWIFSILYCNTTFFAPNVFFMPVLFMKSWRELYYVVVVLM